MSTLIKSPGRSRKVLQTVKTCFIGSRKNTWKRWIDLALYLVSCALGGTGLLMAYRLPHGHGEGRMVKIAASGRLARLAAGIFAGLLIGSVFLVFPVEQRERGTGASIERPPAEWEEPAVLSM